MDPREQGHDVVVLGAGPVGQNAADRTRAAGLRWPKCPALLHSATITVTRRVPIARLWHAVPRLPTISELWLRLLEAYRDSSQDSAGR